jgi:hypothetical protein
MHAFVRPFSKQLSHHHLMAKCRSQLLLVSQKNSGANIVFTMAMTRFLEGTRYNVSKL